MNKLYAAIAMLAMPLVPCHAQDASHNYVKSVTMLDAEGRESLQSVQYYNGLGYPTISVATTGGHGETSYSLVTYDGLGREESQYVPVSTDRSILYKSPSAIISSSSTVYDDAAYSKTLYDALDRPVSVTTAGSAFASKPTRIEYSANGTNEVIRYSVDGTRLVENSFYPANALTKETVTDPDGKIMETFKEFNGNVVLQRVNGTLNTYYVYDYLGFLRFVLPPKYQSDKNLSALCYEYRYDKRGRMTYKKLPGAGYCEYWYDKAGRMTCMRDSVMRSAGKCRFFVYDNLNRLVVQGMCVSCSRGDAVKSATFSSSSTGLLGTGYVMPPGYISPLKGELEIVNYYDGNQNNLVSTAAVYKYLTGIRQVSSGDEQTGMLTATVSSATNGEYVAQTMQYDIKGNLITVQSRELGGRIVSTNCTYSYTNNLSKSCISTEVDGKPLSVNQTYDYNKYIDTKENYSLMISHGETASTSVSYEYDELGRLADVIRNDLPAGKKNVTFAYDMHGWVEKITTNSFKEELFYASGVGTKCYNGNISSIKWKDRTTLSYRGYKFTYDGANRMTEGTYGEGTSLSSNKDRYTERLTYDENGNVTSLLRYGRKSSGNYAWLDNLAMTYNGNQLESVEETVPDYDYTGSFEYKNANGSKYLYNSNGSLVADKSRGIAYITYDFSNNPRQIYFANGSVTKYVYSASGQKLRVIHYTAKPNITRQFGRKPSELTLAQILLADSTDYLLGGSLVMRNGKIDKYLFEGGYAQATATGSDTDQFAFYYYNQDHLGNNREVVDASGVVQQVTNYYPFGAPYADSSSSKNANKQQYKYNGKELDRMHGLDTYDYGARQHDPILARWDRIDPLCEKYYSISPYAYCANNPVRYVDPTGMVVEDPDSLGANYYEYLMSTASVLKEKKQRDIYEEAYLKALDNAISEYHALEKSDQVYVFKLQKELAGTGSTFYEDGKVVLAVGEYNVPLVGHEAKHGYQFEMGEISFREDGSYGSLADINDEVKAYNRQDQLFMGCSFWKGKMNDRSTVINRNKKFGDQFLGSYKNLPIENRNFGNFKPFDGEIYRKIAAH